MQLAPWASDQLSGHQWRTGVSDFFFQSFKRSTDSTITLQSTSLFCTFLLSKLQHLECLLVPLAVNVQLHQCFLHKYLLLMTHSFFKASFGCGICTNNNAGALRFVCRIRGCKNGLSPKFTGIMSSQYISCGRI